MADAANISVELKLGEIRQRLADAKDVMGKVGSKLPVKFSLKVRNLLKKFDAFVCDINENEAQFEQDIKRELGELQERLVVRGKDGMPVLKEGNKFTFANAETEDEYFAAAKVITERNNEHYKALDVELQKKVTVEALGIPSDVLPEELDGKLEECIFEFIVQ